MATSKLQIAVGDLLDKTFPQYRIRENHRPDWLLSPNLTRMELDFFIEELRIGIEVQGAQHYQFTPFFHKTEGDFEKRKEWDKIKLETCERAGVILIEVFCLMDAIIAINHINEKIAPNKFSDGYNEINEIRKRISFVKEKLFTEIKRLRINPTNEGSPENKIKEIKQFGKKVSKRGVTVLNFEFKYLTIEEQVALLDDYGIEVCLAEVPSFDPEKVAEVNKFTRFYNKIASKGGVPRKFTFSKLTDIEIDELFDTLSISSEAKSMLR